MSTDSTEHTHRLQALHGDTLLDFYASRVRFDHYDPFGAEMDHGFSQDELRDEILRRLAPENDEHAQD